MKKIYFAGSIRGGRDDAQLYLQIMQLLSKYGTVLTEHIGDKKLGVTGENLESHHIYERDMAWLNESDIIVAEVSTPSLGVGYELGKAEGRKKILCLSKEQDGRRLSAMIEGNKNFPVKIYKTLEDVENILKDFFANL